MIDANLQSQLREKFNPDVSILRDIQLKILAILKITQIIKIKQ